MHSLWEASAVAAFSRSLLSGNGRSNARIEIAERGAGFTGCTAAFCFAESSPRVAIHGALKTAHGRSHHSLSKAWLELNPVPSVDAGEQKQSTFPPARPPNFATRSIREAYDRVGSLNAALHRLDRRSADQRRWAVT